jgi:flagellar M-ring protein FliF
MKEKLLSIKSKMKTWHYWTIGIILFTIIGFVSVMGMKPDTYQTLYSNLETKDATAIEKELSSSGIDYVMSSDQKTLQVEKTQVAKARMDLANAGLPGSQSEGFELYDSSSLGLTKDERQVKYKRALKGQLEKDLVDGIGVIKRATVELEYDEEENIFLDDEKESKATVIVGLESGKTLSESQIKGIQNLVSAAVKDLKAENVVIVDEEGALISDVDGSSSTATGTGTEGDVTEKTEGRIKNDIMKELSSVFGYDNVRVTVRAKINFDEIVQNIEKYDPTGTLVSSQTSKESSVQKENGTSEPGTESNGDVPEYQTEDSASGATSSTNKEEVTQNFEVGKTVETVKKNPELTYLSVSVAVDQSMTKAEIQELEDHVAVASGLIDQNNDGVYENGNVKVTPFVFKQNQKNTTTTAEKETETGLNKWVMISIGAGIVLLIILLSVMFVLQKRKERKEREDLERQLQDERENSAKRIMEQNMMKTEENEPLDDEEAFQMRKHDLTKEATDAAEENPRRTAEYINKLINEG